jgi:hypothetical protein
MIGPFGPVVLKARHIGGSTSGDTIMKLNLSNVNLDDLGREAVRLGREVAERAHALSLGETALDAGLARRCLNRLKERGPFKEADEGGLAIVDAMLTKSIKSEIIGTESSYFETYFDELGQNGERREVPVYSQRGKDLLDLQQIFQEFVAVRRAILDHVAAHRALISMMSG